MDNPEKRNTTADIMRDNPPPSPISRTQDYLGDGVYAEYEEGLHQIWLRTDRQEGTHEIALDHSTFAALIKFAKRIAGMDV